MAADPHPHKVGTIFHSERPVVEPHPRRPAFAQFLELQRRVTRIPLEKLKVLSRQLLNFVRERIETLPELRRRAMHLEVSQLALLLRCFDFISQEVELARRGILLDLPIPRLPIAFGNPLPQPREVLARQRLYFGLDGFNLRHFRST
jgi:hypothetical protein